MTVSCSLSAAQSSGFSGACCCRLYPIDVVWQAILPPRQAQEQAQGDTMQLVVGRSGLSRGRVGCLGVHGVG